jgi:hypothetical protein
LIGEEKPARLTALLLDIQSALEAGERERAFQLAQEATALAPSDPEAWLWRAVTAQSREESMSSLSRVLGLDPRHSIARRRLHTLLQPVLEEDAFLAYLNEDDKAYTLQTNAGLQLVVPKDRAAAEAYPARHRPALASAYRWLGLALAGLPFAGLATLICAPIAGLRAFLALQHPLAKADRVRAMVLLGLAAVLWACGLVLSGLYLLHL